MPSNHPLLPILLRWQRPLGALLWVLVFAINTVFNASVSSMDNAHAILPAAPVEPWLWEISSTFATLALLPGVVWAVERWPLRWRNGIRHLLIQLGLTVPFCVAHVGLMVALRKLAYLWLGHPYDFGGLHSLGYEYLKDWRSYLGYVLAVSVWRFCLLRLQGEASLLDAPDVGPPVEPVERPERFLVRKLGKEFLIAAQDVEWLQASGNYVNLHVRGRDYPLRTTLAALETRLDPKRFLRVHRSYVVSLDHLREIEPLDTGDARLLMHDGAQLPCSRRYRSLLRERLGDTRSTEPALMP